LDVQWSTPRAATNEVALSLILLKWGIWYSVVPEQKRQSQTRFLHAGQRRPGPLPRDEYQNAALG
jgi:hypothetical protein